MLKIDKPSKIDNPINTALKKQKYTCEIKLEHCNNKQLAKLCGKLDENLHQIEHELNVEIFNRDNSFQICGKKKTVTIAKKILLDLYKESTKGKELAANQVHLSIQQFSKEISTLPTKTQTVATKQNNVTLATLKGTIQARTKNQDKYLKNIFAHDINFGIGPAGTGKTFLAVAAAIHALQQQKISKIILVHPVVEAGEKLGFLPGDLLQKIDPYLRPLYDALYEMLGFDKVAKLLEYNTIEVAPLAYMRGRSLNDSFIILDEAQNTTTAQMKMFLTRMGFNSIAVITGDITQIDLPKGIQSGLCQAEKILAKIPEISFTYFQTKDVIRHSIVQKIITAYEKEIKSCNNEKKPRRKAKPKE